MADQIFNVNCGFFDAVDNDRTYSAAQMNLPYKRIVANGVFATQQGTPSSDLQVQASSGMAIIVNKGDGLFANMWFTNPTNLSIEVPSNTALNSRLDSVIVQVDKRISGRTGNIVYRTGTPAESPEAPLINGIPNVIEYRVANVLIAPSASSISDADITDLRGSSECPWVTSLIQQVDTSTLWSQFNAAYTEQFAEYGVEYEEYIENQRQTWEDFISSLTEELTVETSVSHYTSSYTAEGSVSVVPINIPSFNPDTDVLQVYINGLYADEGEKYTVDAGGDNITLAAPIAAGNSVYFVVLKSLINANIESTTALIERLENKIDDYMKDTGWFTLTLSNGSAVSNALRPALRCIGNRVYIRGAFKGITAAGTTICTLPVNYRPTADHTFTASAVGSTAVNDTLTITISASDGTVTVSAVSETISATDGISLSTTYIATYGGSIGMNYVYKGSVANYAGLPNNPKNGDVYTVLAADSTHSIEAGDNVLWNGAEWEVTEIANADTTIISDTTSTTYDFNLENMNNREVRLFATLTALTFTVPTALQDKYLSGLSFLAGATAPTISYSGAGVINWVGSDCSLSEGNSSFSPQANMQYDIVFLYNGRQIIGMVNGFAPASGNV